MAPRLIAPHLLFHLVQAQLAGGGLTLDELVDLVKVRRVDVRRTLTAMDRSDLLDVRRMRLTLRGFALGLVLREEALPVLRQTHALHVVAA
ncbi:MAG: hypothetical protein WCI05_15400 [Myxococcales bacterium]